MATLLELAKIKHHAVRSDGAKFLDGVRNDSLNTSWLTVNSSGRVTLGPGLYDELLVVKGEVSDEQIITWASMGAPFYDPSPVIQENQIPAAETWSKAVHDAQRALADAADAQATADGKVTTFYQDTEPIAEALGDLWVHTGEDNKLYRWSGSSWEVVQDKKIQEAVQKAEDAQATADGKIITFYQDTAPTADGIGDLWVDTSDNNRLYRWDGTSWVDIQDKSPIPDDRIPSADKWDQKARTFYQDTPPVASGQGDIWIDTSDYNHMYRWNGTTWRDANDNSPLDAGQRPVTAAGGNVKIDEHGAFGYYNGVVRSGFGTDGRWMAGGGAVTADELGLMVKDIVEDTLRLHLGNVGGQPWGNGVLAPDTYGLWGDQAGLYLRGYSSLILAQECSDGDIVAVPEDYTLANPSVMITPRDVLIYHPNMTERVNLITDAVQKSEREWQIVAKLVMRGGANVTEWAPVKSSSSQRIIDVVVPVGQEADYFICRPSWHIQGAGGNVIFGFGITDEFDSLGNPTDSYVLVKSFSRDSNGSGMLNWDMPFPHKGRWAVRFSGTGSTTLGITTGRVGVDRWGWSFGNRYLDNDGNEINVDELSGVGVVVQILDQG